MTLTEDDPLLPPKQVRVKFGIAPSTLREWAATGKIAVARRTLGGHRRYRESEVREVVAATEPAVAS